VVTNAAEDLANHLPAAVWQTDANGSNFFQSKRWYEYVGEGEGTSYGSDWLRFYHPNDRAFLEREWRRALSSGGAHRYDIEVRIRRHDGAYRWFPVQGEPVRRPDGTIERWIGTCTDVHDQRRLKTLLAGSVSALRRWRGALLHHRSLPRTFSLQTRALLLLAVSLLPFVGYVFYQSNEERHEARELAAASAYAMALQVTNEKSRAIEATRSMMAGLLKGARAGSLLGPSCGRILARAVKSDALFAGASVADANGNLRCSTTSGLETVNIADRPYFRQVMNGEDFLLAGPVQSRTTGRQVLIAAAPIAGADGEAQGALVLTIDLGAIARALANQKLPEGTLVTLVNPQGTIMARHPDPEGYVGRTVPELAEFERFVSSPDAPNVAVARAIDGVERLFAYARTPGTAGSFLYGRVGIPQSQIEAAAQRVLWSGLATVAVVLLIVCLLGWIGARVLIGNPLRKLTAAAGRLGEGDLSARTGLPASDDEIGLLAAALDKLAGYNQRSTRALKALSAGNRTLLRATEEMELLQNMCRVAVERAGYRLAIVNYARHDAERSVDSVAYAGHNQGFVEALNLTWADTERGRGSVGAAIRSRQAVIVRSIAKDPRFASWREKALQHDFGSIISLPLWVGGEVIGTLTLLAREEDAFDQHEVELLDEMAADLSFGIDGLRRRQAALIAEQRAQRAETHDAQSELPTRAAGVLALQKCIGECAARKEPAAVMVVHFPELRELFDTFGYEPGTRIVRALAGRIASIQPDPTLVARIGTEEFLMIFPGADAERGGRFARDMLAALVAPAEAGAALIEVRACIGTAFYPGHGDDAEVLVRRAGAAAREGFRRSHDITVHDSSANALENTARLTLVSELRSAIDRRSLILHYQPKLDLGSSKVVGCEALIRWPHEHRGMIPPSEFIPVAERSGLIRPLTSFVIESAVRQIRQWMVEGKRMPVAVNLPARALYDDRVFEQLEGLLGTWGVPPELLHFEITESALIDDPSTARATLERLRELGTVVYIDDFGTGYSSLSYLVSLPVHALKIDRSFVSGMTSSPEADSLVSSIITMAHKLRLKVVAEGVETNDQLRILRTLGCDEAQGYFVSRPVGAEHFWAATGAWPPA
jgi:diguanylate cyclase